MKSNGERTTGQEVTAEILSTAERAAREYGQKATVSTPAEAQLRERVKELEAENARLRAFTPPSADDLKQLASGDTL